MTLSAWSSLPSGSPAPALLTNFSWLNEGWTVYLERRILAAIHGDSYFDFSSIIGWKELGQCQLAGRWIAFANALLRGCRRALW